MKIFLIGMPGSGKSVIGKQLALHFDLPFIDLDSAIEEAAGKSVQEIFKADGEAYFRQKEAEQLREKSSSMLGFVMATGGGAPCFHNGMEVIHQVGVSIYLDVPLDELVKRNSNNSSRPLLQEGGLETKLSALLSSREAIYKRATFSVAGNQITVKDIIALLKKQRLQ